MFNKKVLSKIKMGKSVRPNPYKKDIIADPMGQWNHPGENTRIPSDRITMKGVNYPVLGVSNTGQKQMMQPGREYDFPGADYVDEYPQMKRGGAKKKFTSDIINSTNYLFAEHPLFKKKKQSKKRIYSPNAKYYQPGGETYNQLPARYRDALKNFTYPEVVDSSEETGYDAALGIIKQNPNDPIANVNNPWWYEHELMHHLQNQAGGMSTYGAVGLRPNPYVASDEAIGSYYDRRGSEFETELNRILEENPDIPEEEAYARAEEDLYNNPTTTEGEARNYEGYIEAGNPSIFPKKQKGGKLPEGKYGYSVGNLIRKQDGGNIDYQIGDEVDEATMRRLKKLGFTFEKI